MCGIAGIATRERPIDTEALVRANVAQSHRGPDGGNIWIAPHRTIGLAHRRLSIIDLATGEQPTANEDGTIHAVVNGEFYGFETIRKDLESRGHCFRSRSDSEILPHLYEEWRHDCLRFLRGEFAFILWDERNRTLFAARDRFGVKPLLYAEHDGSLYLASEAKALFSAGLPARWNTEALLRQVLVGVNWGETLFHGVRQVPPGCYLLARSAQSELRTYWNLDLPVESLSPSPEDYSEELRWRLEEAVRVRMRADVPVCSFLSGGLDSSVVFRMAADHAGATFRAFTVAFSEDEFNESPIARDTAREARREITVVPVTSDQMAENVSDAVWHAETLGINWHGIARYLLCREIQTAGYKVALSGEGADEVFGGYVQFRQDAGLVPCEQKCTGPLENLRKEFGFVPAWLDRLAVNRSIFWLLFDQDVASDITAEGVYRRFLAGFDWERQLCGRTPLRKSMYMWTRSILPNYTLQAEKLEMAHGVETRPPFLDHELFLFARQIPESLLITDSTEKHILREAARPLLSETVYKRTKHPFFAPPAYAQKSDRVRQVIEDTLRGATLAALPVFSQKAVCGLLDQLPRMSESKRVALDPALLLIVSACMLQERLGLTC